MNIAHVVATFPPYMAGTGNVAYNQARLLHERGHQVTVFTAAINRPHPDLPSFPFTVKYLPTVLRFGNAPLTPNLLKSLSGFDLIHLHYPYIFGAELTLAASKRFHIPYVLTYHNQLLQPGSWKQALFTLYNRIMEPLILKHSQAVMAVSLDHFESLHPDAQRRVWEVPNGVDTEVFRPLPRDICRTQLGLPLDRPIVLFVGALDKAHQFKNIPMLLDAMQQVGQSTNALLVIVGTGDMQSVYENYAQCDVQFMGQVNHSNLPPYFSAADVTVLPSSVQESFGLVL
ncbi:MAG: glycosyltransferase family 4 protein, partial [Sulfobacillus sp.]